MRLTKKMLGAHQATLFKVSPMRKTFGSLKKEKEKKTKYRRNLKNTPTLIRPLTCGPTTSNLARSEEMLKLVDHLKSMGITLKITKMIICLII